MVLRALKKTGSSTSRIDDIENPLAEKRLASEVMMARALVTGISAGTNDGGFAHYY
jgi:hypothetical protein